MKEIDNYYTYHAWKNIGFYPHHGINVPLFSLRSRNSCGVGEILDLIPLIDFCVEIHFDIIQLLPLHDTGLDPSPYNALSSIALHPIYVSLKSLPFLDEYDELKEDLKRFDRLNQLERVDYLHVLSSKMTFLKRYHELCFKKVTEDKNYQNFIRNEPWIKEYALFKALKNKHANETWEHWMENKTIDQLYEREKEHMHFYMHVQFLLFQQLKRVKEYADEKKVFLKGDIPILISPDSHDVWAHQEYFHLDFSAGAPPDMFCPEGQNWGFPLYNWKVMEENDFDFWKRRLQYASHFYHLYRIDHIIGLYRIWGIPKGKEAKEGFYIPGQIKDAIEQGEKILKKLISFTDMLPIGEDLGSNIDEIKNSLAKLGVPGTKVPRWERYYATTGAYIPYNKYHPLSLTTISTHDSQTLLEWWMEFPEDAKKLVESHNHHYDLRLSKAIRLALLKDSHKSASLFHINLLNEYLALEEDLVFSNPKEERINIPGTRNPSNWTYRFRNTIEDLLENKTLVALMQTLAV